MLIIPQKLQKKKKKIIKQLSRYAKLETWGIDKKKKSVCIYIAPNSIIIELEKQNLFKI